MKKNELGKLIPANAYLLLVVPFVTMMVGPFIHGIVLDWLLNGSAIFMILFAIVATIAFAKVKAYQAIVLIWLTVLTALTPFIMAALWR
ncbi:MAG: hypothetical protein K2H48_00025 [Duncaniella sp.]|nr:hypothetical protein [Duncaniella sp.]